MKAIVVIFVLSFTTSVRAQTNFEYRDSISGKWDRDLNTARLRRFGYSTDTTNESYFFNRETSEILAATLQHKPYDGVVFKFHYLNGALARCYVRVTNKLNSRNYREACYYFRDGNLVHSEEGAGIENDFRELIQKSKSLASRGQQLLASRRSK